MEGCPFHLACLNVAVQAHLEEEVGCYGIVDADCEMEQSPSPQVPQLSQIDRVFNEKALQTAMILFHDKLQELIGELFQ